MNFLKREDIPNWDCKSGNFSKFFEYVLNAYFAQEDKDPQVIETTVEKMKLGLFKPEYLMDLNKDGESVLMRAVKNQDQVLFNLLASFFKGEEFECLLDAEDKEGAYGLALFCDHTTSYVQGEGYPLGLTVQFSGNGIFYRNYRKSHIFHAHSIL